MVLTWALPFGKEVDFVVYFLIVKDSWVDLHTPMTDNHTVVHYQEEKNLLAEKRN